ncbi:hypothetical protein CC78DRAFT_603770 [Lojkania enalia]|uniref:Uncharacterized protein n=1 Tax=Lojkania enalia TaxID=147567 RepID=A0A9P4N2N0_9PLEO|nr:hypothetical protein CC78DRAFT_603770 [Didymosphaeria enalia]
MPQSKMLRPRSRPITFTVEGDAAAFTSNSTFSPSESSQTATGFPGQPPKRTRTFSSRASSSTSNTPTTSTPPTNMESSTAKRKCPNQLFGSNPFSFNISRHHRSAERKASKSSTTSYSSNFSTSPISPTTTVDQIPNPAHRRLSSLLTLTYPPPAEEYDMEFLFDEAVTGSSTGEKSPGSASEPMPLTPALFRAHPGTLVPFSSTSEPEFHTPRYSETALDTYQANQLRSPSSPLSTAFDPSPMDNLSSSEYHHFLKSASRPSRTSRYEATTNISIHGRSSRRPRLENVDYKARKAERRARSMEEQDRVRREGSDLPPGSPPLPSPFLTACNRSQSMNTLSRAHKGGKRRKGSCDSERSANSYESAEIFLHHVKESFAAREARRGWDDSYDIFLDEDENGFIGDEPL